MLLKKLTHMPQLRPHVSALASKGTSNMRGCRTHHVLSAGHRLFSRKFSAPVASANADWILLFEECFGNSPVVNSDEKQALGSSTFLLDKAMKKYSRQDVSKDDLELLEDAERLQHFKNSELPHIFKQIIEEMSVDHAVMYCNHLPASDFSLGINTLIMILLDKAQLCEQDDLGRKIFELVKVSRDKKSSLLKETRQRLLEWSLNNGDELSAKHVLEIIEENSESAQAHNAEIIEPKYAEPNCIFDDEHKCKNKVFNIWDKVDFTDPVYRSQVLSVFNEAGKTGLIKGKESLIELQKFQLKGIQEDDRVALIDAFTKGLTEENRNSRDVRRAVEIFKWTTQQLQLNSVSSYNMLIAHSAIHGEIDACVHLIQMMKDHGLEPCALTYEPLIKLFSSTLEISKAEDILRVMLLSGMQATTKAYIYLIGAHAKAGNMERAFNLLESVPDEHRTAELYSSIIHEYGMQGHIVQAVSLLQKMQQGSIKPSGESFAVLIQACAIRKNYTAAEKVFNLYRKQGEFSKEEQKLVLLAMLRIYAARGDSRQLEKVLSCTENNLLMSFEVKCSIMHGFAETGSIEKALKIYNEIRNEGSFPGSVAFCSLLYNVGKAGELNQLLFLFEQFRKSMERKHRVYQEKNMSVACSHVVHALVSHNHLEEALAFLQRIQLEDAGDAETLCLKVFMEDKGNDDDSKRVPVALKDKISFLQLMRQRLQIQPIRLAYESLLESCAKEKDSEYAATILGMMNSDNMPLNVFTCMILLRIVIGRGNLKKSKLLISEIKRTMQENGLMDRHVKMLVMEILKSGKVSKLFDSIYPEKDVVRI